MRERRKPFGVWMLLSGGERWLFRAEPTLAAALVTGRVLIGETPLFPNYRVWIARPDQPAYLPRSTYMEIKG